MKNYITHYILFYIYIYLKLYFHTQNEIKRYFTVMGTSSVSCISTETFSTSKLKGIQGF